MRRLLYLGLGLGLLTACEEDPAAPHSEPCVAFLTAFTAASGDTVTTINGVRYLDIELGTGRVVQVGDVVNVNYSGYRTSGVNFDSNCPGNGDALFFQLGSGDLIPGFEAGMIGMRNRGVRRMLVPTAQAYPPGSQHPLAGLDLIFDVQLLTVN